MANHKSAEKRARQSLKRKARNSQRKASVKTSEKSLSKAIAAKASNAQELLKKYTSEAMKAVSKGALKKETAARKIARLSKQIQKTLGA